MIPKHIMIHHTAGNEKSADALRAIFKSRFSVNYIGYHYAIAPNGDIWKDLKDTDMGIHNNVGDVNNTNSLAISFVGDFTSKDPSVAQMETAKRIIRQVKGKFTIQSIVGHRDEKQTACPGNRLYARLGELRAAQAGPPPQENDMIRADLVKQIYTVTRGAAPTPDWPDYILATSDRPDEFVLDMIVEAKNRGIDIGKQQAGGGGTPPSGREVSLLELLQTTKVKIV
jgi:hypothetical protein